VLPGPPVNVTTAFGVAVPEMTGLSVAVPLVAGVVIATVGGAIAVTVTGTEVDPPGLAAVTVSVFGPAGTVTGQAKVPLAEAVVLHRVTGPGPVITIGVPGVAVPEMVGVSVVNGPGWTTVRLGAATAVTVTRSGALVPPILLDTAVMTFVPGDRPTVQEKFPR
jgi:hypothetical protein